MVDFSTKSHTHADKPQHTQRERTDTRTHITAAQPDRARDCTWLLLEENARNTTSTGTVTPEGGSHKSQHSSLPLASLRRPRTSLGLISAAITTTRQMRATSPQQSYTRHPHVTARAFVWCSLHTAMRLCLGNAGGVKAGECCASSIFVVRSKHAQIAQPGNSNCQSIGYVTDLLSLLVGWSGWLDHHEWYLFLARRVQRVRCKNSEKMRNPNQTQRRSHCFFLLAASHCRS